jgi:hypothetical protein
MLQFLAWPPPDWHEVVVTWDQILYTKHINPNQLYQWCEQHPGARFHVHGWQSTEGFAFRFEHKQDAVVFALTWV